MATWAVGDIQGCYATLHNLVERLGYHSSRDRLWLVGDLVNRGLRSLEVLRWARAQGERVTVVLGNHDLHLLGRAYGLRKPKKRDTLDEILHAPDRGELIDWLRHRPLLHREGDRVLVHAGLLPAWTFADAEREAHRLEKELQGPSPEKALRALSKGPIPAWSPEVSRAEARRAALQAFTRLRTLDAQGVPDDEFSGPPAEAPGGLRPWWEWPSPRDAKTTIVCGHWAALGLFMNESVIAVDTGCVWGRTLTAVRLEDLEVVQEPLAD